MMSMSMHHNTRPGLRPNQVNKSQKESSLNPKPYHLLQYMVALMDFCEGRPFEKIGFWLKDPSKPSLVQLGPGELERGDLAGSS